MSNPNTIAIIEAVLAGDTSTAETLLVGELTERSNSIVEAGKEFILNGIEESMVSPAIATQE